MLADHLSFRLRADKILNNIFVPRYYDPQTEGRRQVLSDTHDNVSEELYEQFKDKLAVRAKDLFVVRDGTYLVGTYWYFDQPLNLDFGIREATREAEQAIPRGHRPLCPVVPAMMGGPHR
ncbi:MAG: hypothetical protein H8E90_07030 [Anaerolineales bacterium]|nr:hypothetical protein [Anaerolineales bacterium]